MQAVTWHGHRDVRVETVPDPGIQDDRDAIVRITSSALCGSDLHLYEVFGPFLSKGDVLGHEPMGIVEEVGRGVTSVAKGDRVVVPFGIACGTCFMCTRGMQSQCETTQVRREDKGAALFGYTRLYGSIPGGQAEYLRVPFAEYGLMKVPEGPPDDRFLFLSDVLPTAWQAVEYAGIAPGGSVAILGLGPIGNMASRVARHRGADKVIGIDRVPDRLDRARALGVETIDLDGADDVAGAVREMTGGRGPDAVIDAVGIEAHGSPITETMQKASGLLPDPIQGAFMQRLGVDRLSALRLAIDLVRRGGTLSIAGVYAGAVDPVPMITLFDKQVTIRMGQANVRRWTDDLMPLLIDGDPLGVEGFASHHVGLEKAPQAYDAFQKKADGTFKVVFRP
jgi:threonine dehydrogenase-like Zn-dependent dehydrogenase